MPRVAVIHTPETRRIDAGRKLLQNARNQLTANTTPVPGIAASTGVDNWPALAGATAAAVLLKGYETTETNADGKKTVRFSVVSDEERVSMAQEVAKSVNSVVLNHNAIAEKQAQSESEDTESEEDEDDLDDMDDDDDE